MRASAARKPKRDWQIERAAADLIELELRRHGARTAAELLLAVQIDPQLVYEGCVQMVEAGRLRVAGGKFEMRSINDQS